MISDPDGLLETARVNDVEAAIDAMVSHVANSAMLNPLRVGVGHAERPELAAVLIERLDAVPGVVELVPTRSGPRWAPTPGPARSASSTARASPDRRRRGVRQAIGRRLRLGS